MPRVVHFEIPADDPQRAVSFYEKALGWTIRKVDGPADYWLVMTGEQGQPGIDGAIQRRSGAGTVCNVVDVPSVDEYTAKVVEAGGKVVEPKMTVSGVGYVAYCVDPEGNTFGLIQEDTSVR